MGSVLPIVAGGLAIVGVVLLVVIGVGAVVALLDLGGRREEQEQWLRTRVTRRLERDRRFDTTAVVPVVHVGPDRSPVVIEVHGEVPSHGVRRGLLDAVADEVERSRPGRDVTVDDRLRVDERHVHAA